MTTAQLIRVCGDGHRSILPNGKAKGLEPSEFDPQELSKGIRVEREHTSSDRVACAIAMDHLVEDPRYYTKLAKIHHEEPDMRKRRKKDLKGSDASTMGWIALIGGVAVIGLALPLFVGEGK